MTHAITIGELHSLTASLVVAGHAHLPVLIPTTRGGVMKTACATALSAAEQLPGTENDNHLYKRDPFTSMDRPLTGLQLY
jgi:hypothetical protein